MVRFLDSEKGPKVKRNDQPCPLLTLLGYKELQNKREKNIFILISVNSCLLNTKSSMEVMADLGFVLILSFQKALVMKRCNHIQLILLVCKGDM